MQYTLEQYRNLCYEDNHTIIKDGSDFYWYSKKDNAKFTIHCIKSFTDSKKVASHIRYWIPKYKKLAICPKDCIENMLKQLKLEDEIEVIANNKDINLTKKIGKILVINPNIKPKELALILDVTKMTISRQLKLFKAI
jgi:DeoR/GlpR family transcriptional regulator of sugar metabolism